MFSSLVYLTNVFDEGGIFLLIIGDLVHSFHVGIVGVVDEERGASRRKTEEEWRDWSWCSGLVFTMVTR